jgi:resuscitation-promoting factor RpfB
VLAKAGLIGAAALMLCCGGLATLVAVADPQPDTSPATSAAETTALPSPSGEATPSPSIAATESPSPTVVATPAIEKGTVTERQAIPFTSRRVNDSSLAKGTTRVRTAGVAGVKTFTYELTFTNGVQTDKKLVRETITKPPVTQVIAVGTKEAPRCDPNYSGACVPIASDVDCAGGSGNGPAYVDGPVRVIGRDIYDLDANGDGIGCES